MWLSSPWFRSLFDKPGFRRSLTPPRRRSRVRPRRRSGGPRRIEGLEDRCLLSFNPVLSYPVGNEPAAIVSGDFNGDGRLDLATAGQTGVDVLLGNGQGGFGAAVHSATGTSLTSLAVGDFNGDGKLDLAAANGGSGDVSVLLGNGDGSFRAGTSAGVGAAALSVAVGDFNADGKLDLTVSSQSERIVGYYGYYGGYYTRTEYQGHVNVLLGNGTGGFATPKTSDINGGFPTGLAVADLNADGRLDVVTANDDRWTVSVLLGNGDGTLRYSGWPSDFATGANPRAVTVGDFTGDGKPDLVTAGSAVDVLPGLGDGTFQGVRATYIDPVAIATADFNHDGKLDVATADPGSDSLAVLLGLGTGAFTSPVEFVGSRPSAVAVGDFNGDGRADVAANSDGGTVSVLLNDGIWPALNAPTLSVNDITLTEGNTGSVDAVFTVTLSAASTRDVTVRYVTADGQPWNSATAGSDYGVRSGLVTIRAGQTSATVVVPVYGDRLAEPAETFFVRLSDSTNAFIADGSGMGTILDDEPFVSVGSASALEGNAGTTAMTFTVSLSAASDAPVAVEYATIDGTATAGTDYEAKTGTVVFAAGQTTATVTVLVYGDRVAEWDEYFLLELGDPPGAHVSAKWGYGTITDDEPRITIDPYSVGVTEGNGGTAAATFTVRLSAACDAPVSVNFSTAEGDTAWWGGWNGYYYYGPEPVKATAGVDYQSQAGTLTFAPGETAKTVTVLVNGDRAGEPDEAFSVDLGGAAGALVTSGHATATIYDDEPRVSIGYAQVTEGNAGTKVLTFAVTLSAAYDQEVRVAYATADGSATAGTDYQAASGTLVFAPGQTAATISVVVYGDRVAEWDESLLVLLGTPTANAVIASGTGYGTITDDEPRVSVGDARVTEGNSGTRYLTFTVTLSAAYDASVTVNYATQDGTAVAGSDYKAASGTLTFAKGETTKTVTIAIYGDSTVESDEYFYLRLSSPSGDVQLANDLGIALIVNDDKKKGNSRK